MALTNEQVKKFYDEGFLIIPDFADEDTIQRLRSECRRLVDEMDPDDINTVFSTEEWVDDSKFKEKTDISKAQSWTNDDYFLQSGNNISFFFEDGAKDEEGKLLVDKHQAINKMAHAIHGHSDIFRAYTFSKKVQDVATSIGMVDPIVCQSMYIFKPPKIGGAVNPHQDSCFLNTNPMRLVGFWLALEDATEENGCLWFIPKSHKDGLHGNRRFIRTPRSELKAGESETKFIGDHDAFDKYVDQNKFVSGPVKKGTLVLIHGEVVHKSEKNVSSNSREIYTFHVYDQHNVEWNNESWHIAAAGVPNHGFLYFTHQYYHDIFSELLISIRHEGFEGCLVVRECKHIVETRGCELRFTPYLDMFISI